MTLFMVRSFDEDSTLHKFGTRMCHRNE